MPPLLTLENISKRFPGVLANDNLTFSVDRGGIHALLGENGAGKSTLVKMIYGVMQPDAGMMRLNDNSYSPPNPAAARQAGVGMVFQHFSLFEAMSVTENIALAIPGKGADRHLADKIASVSASYHLPINPGRLVGELSVGERQRVEIVRCLMQSPDLLIMDEPTSVLTPQEANLLFGTLRALSADGVAILYISHRLAEIRDLCDAATVLRGGKVVANCDPRQETASSLAEMMIGKSLAVPEAPANSPGRVRLEARGLSTTAAGPFGVSLKSIDFTVRAGEILGIGGVAGNGQAELMEALTGENLADDSMLQVDMDPIGTMPPTKRRSAGMAFAPEERLGHALSPLMSLVDNAFITARHTRHLSRGGWLSFRSAIDYTRSIIGAFDVRTTSENQRAHQLSGGNLQKYVIGREILQQPKVLVVSQPTWGVDAAAAAAIHEALVELAREGAAVVVISQDLDELMRLSNRIAVLADGALSELRPTKDVTVEEIGLSMGGVTTSKQSEIVHAAA